MDQDWGQVQHAAGSMFAERLLRRLYREHGSRFGRGLQFHGFGLAKTLLCVHICLYHYCARVTATTWLHAAIENAGYAVVIPWVSCSDR